MYLLSWENTIIIVNRPQRNELVSESPAFSLVKHGKASNFPVYLNFFLPLVPAQCQMHNRSPQHNLFDVCHEKGRRCLYVILFSLLYSLCFYLFISASHSQLFLCAAPLMSFPERSLHFSINISHSPRLSGSHVAWPDKSWTWVHLL